MTPQEEWEQAVWLHLLPKATEGKKREYRLSSNSGMPEPPAVIRDSELLLKLIGELPIADFAREALCAVVVGKKSLNHAPTKHTEFEHASIVGCYDGNLSAITGNARPPTPAERRDAFNATARDREVRRMLNRGMKEGGKASVEGALKQLLKDRKKVFRDGDDPGA